MLDKFEPSLSEAPAFATEKERGETAYLKGYRSGLRSLSNRISHHLAARIPFKSYPMNLEQGMVSFSFDDISQSAAILGAELLEKYNTRGTYYIATDLIGRHISHSQKATLCEIQALYKKGHEIGLHSHEHLPVFAYSYTGLESDLEENREILEQKVNAQDLQNFCYPYGVTSFGAKWFLKNKVRSARCLWGDLNHKRIDPLFLRSRLIDAGTIDEQGIIKAIQDAKDKKGWLIFISHNVEREKSGLTTPLYHLETAIKTAQHLNLPIVTINEGLSTLKVPKLNFKA